MSTTRRQQEYLDCIAMKRKIQLSISAETRGMTPEERLAHYRTLTERGPFANLLKRRKSESKK